MQPGTRPDLRPACVARERHCEILARRLIRQIGVMKALRIDYEDFWALMDERPALAQGVIKVLALRLDAAMENLQKNPS